jgi:hypothetical protein
MNKYTLNLFILFKYMHPFLPEHQQLISFGILGIHTSPGILPVIVSPGKRTFGYTRGAKGHQACHCSAFYNKLMHKINPICRENTLNPSHRLVVAVVQRGHANCLHYFLFLRHFEIAISRVVWSSGSESCRTRLFSRVISSSRVLL